MGILISIKNSTSKKNVTKKNPFQVKPAAFLSVYPVEIQRKFLKISTPICSADKVQTGKVENTKDQIQQ